MFLKQAERKTGAYLSLWENFRRKKMKTSKQRINFTLLPKDPFSHYEALL